MKLRQAKGNTWYLDDWMLIPLYRLDEHRCVLIDTGLEKDWPALSEALEREQLTPVAAIATHIHYDHTGNLENLRRRYGTQVILPAGEIGPGLTELDLLAFYYYQTPRHIHRSDMARAMLTKPDRLVQREDESVLIEGASFGIVHTTGHSSAHLCVRTPDNVLCLGDAVLYGKALQFAKLPYTFVMEEMLASLDRLSRDPAELFIACHRGVTDDIAGAVEAERAYFDGYFRMLLELMERPCSAEELTGQMFLKLGLKLNAGMLLYGEFCVRSFLAYLVDNGKITRLVEDARVKYQVRAKAAE